MRFICSGPIRLSISHAGTHPGSHATRDVDAHHIVVLFAEITGRSPLENGIYKIGMQGNHQEKIIDGGRTVPGYQKDNPR